MFQNLFDNAIKYRRENVANPYIHTEVVEEKGGVVKIVVSDNGCGIPKKYQPEIFKMFYRANEKAKGMGLGLYAVKNSVKKLGGQIYLNSKVHEGTSFTILLPNASQQEVMF